MKANALTAAKLGEYPSHISVEITDRLVLRHSKADCTEPRVFKGTCRNCGEPGHEAKDCENNRKIDRSHIADMSMNEAWVKVEEADREKDLDSLREVRNSNMFLF